MEVFGEIIGAVVTAAAIGGAGLLLQEWALFRAGKGGRHG